MLLNFAFLAGPSSPPYPFSPVPAIVVMMPLLSILRTRWPMYSARKRLPERSKSTANGICSFASRAGPPSPPSPSPATSTIFSARAAATLMRQTTKTPRNRKRIAVDIIPPVAARTHQLRLPVYPGGNGWTEAPSFPAESRVQFLQIDLEDLSGRVGHLRRTLRLCERLCPS